MRTFIALEISDNFRLQVIELARCLRSQVKGRFVSPDNYHLTMAFLGDVSEHDVQFAMDAMDKACAFANEVFIECDGLGKFGKGRDATLWLGVRESDECMSLASAVRDALEACAIDFDRKPFKPHITIARRATISSRQLQDLPFPEPDYATAVTLFKSDLDPEGATYTPLYRVMLKRGN